MEGYKKAALHLHGLEPRDRQWVLGQLLEHQRERLSPLLAELQALGIPKESSILPILDPEVADNDVPDLKPEASVPYCVRVISQAEPDLLASILQAEADVVISAVLQAGTWPWQRAVLERLPIERQHTVQEMNQVKKPVTERFRLTVLQVLADRIAQTPPLPTVSIELSSSEKPRTARSMLRRLLPWPR